MVTQFERDLQEAMAGRDEEVMSRREAEIERLIKEGEACRNTFRIQCIAQELVRLLDEYKRIIDSI